MTELADHLLHAPVVTRHQPWPRVELDGAGWLALVEQLAREKWELVALWADPPMIHVCLRDAEPGTLMVASHRCADGTYESIGQVRPGAIRLERSARDLFGLTALNAPDGGRGSTTVAGPPAARWALSPSRVASTNPRRARPTTDSCRSKAKACIRSRWDRSMPASSSRGISASTPTARRWCGSRSGSAGCTRASRA
jgi:hypothetical protein